MENTTPTTADTAANPLGDNTISMAALEALAGPEPGFWDDAEVISAYSRAQAIADGVLVDVTTTAALMGFKVPVALTDRLATVLKLRAMVSGCPRRELFSLLAAFKAEIAQPGNGQTDRLYFSLPSLAGADGEQVWSLIGPGDTPEPVITIMLLGED